MTIFILENVYKKEQVMNLKQDLYSNTPKHHENKSLTYNNLGYIPDIHDLKLRLLRENYSFQFA